jgi:hypothetical protein
MARVVVTQDDRIEKAIADVFVTSIWSLWFVTA